MATPAKAKPVAPERFPWNRVYIYLLVVLAITGTARMLAFLAVQFWSGISGSPAENAREIADEVSLWVGGLALLGMFILLATEA
jgi:hypothetical protein